MSAWVAADVEPNAASENLERFNQLYDGVEFALDQLDRTRFDLAALSDSLDSDPLALAAWVKDHIAWVAYEGLLKGSEGTLLAGQGNSLDRAVLLARLFIDKGYKTRVVGAPVEEELSPMLRQALKASGSKSWTRGASGEREVDYPGWAEVTGKSIEAVKADIEQASKNRQEFETGVNTLTGSFSDVMLRKVKFERNDQPTEPSHHYWVEYASANSDEWQAVSPLFLEKIPSEIVSAKSESYESIAEMPDAMKHRMVIRFVVERLESGTTSEAVPLEYRAESWKVANRQIDFGFSGKHALQEENAIEQVTVDPIGFAVGFRESVLNETDWVPYVQVEDGESKVDQQFNSQGILSNADESMGESNAKTLGKAISLFGSLGMSDATDVETVLKSVRIEFEFHAPGAPVEREVRWIFDANDGDFSGDKLTEDARSRRGEALGRQFNGLVLVGKVNRDWNDAIQLDTFLQTRMLANYLFRVGDEDSQKLGQSLAKINQKLSQRETALHALAVARMADPDTYLGITNLLCLSNHNKFSSDGSHEVSVIKGFDWIKNRVSVMHEDSRKAAEIALRNGIRDTVLETQLQERIGKTLLPNAITAHQGNTFATEWVDARTLDAYANLEVQRAIQSDLNAGYQVFASRSSQGLQWWRIDPSTGETLGFAYSGDRIAGVAMTEYQMQLTLIAINTIKCLGGYYACARDKKGFGCYLCHWIGAAAGILGAVGSVTVGFVLSSADGVAGTFCNIFG